MEASSAQGKDRKGVFQRSRKRPDVVQSHTPELEKQMASLSSRLLEIDSCITSHGEAVEDAELVSPRGSVSCTDSRVALDSAENADDRDRDSDKSAGRSSSLKFSVQKLFAHRTFAKGNRNGNKKQSAQSEEGISRSKPTFNHSKSEPPPDVIDMTSRASDPPINIVPKLSLDTNDIYAPPQSFMTDDFDLSKTLPRNRHKSPKDKIISKLNSSHSFSHHDRLSSRLNMSASSPSITKLVSNNDVAPPTGHVSARDRSSDQLIDSWRTTSPAHTRPRATKSPRVPASPRREVNPNALAEIEVRNDWP